jgi:DNA-directed RNA polymerase subunit RPC12/RpoP
MRAQITSSEDAPPCTRCPDCGAPMRLVSLMPMPKPKVQGADEIVYRCERCKVELKRITKRLRR